MVVTRLQSVPRARLEEAWAVYRETHFPRLSPRTRTEYTCCLRRALAELPPVVSLGSLLVWRASLLDLRDYDASYVNLHLVAVRTVARRASIFTGDHELQALVWQCDLLRRPTRPPRCPPRDHLRRTLGAARNTAERAWLLLAGLGGLRYGELLALMPDDYDRDRRLLRVVRQRHVDHRKNWRPHLVRTDYAELRWALEWTIAHREEVRPRTGQHRGVSARYLFPWSAKYAEIFLGRIRNHLGADAHRYLPRGIGWHAWRHWGASELALGGASVLDVMAWLGDADESMAACYVRSVRGISVGATAHLAATLEDSPGAVQAAPGANPLPETVCVVPTATGRPLQEEVSDEPRQQQPPR